MLLFWKALLERNSLLKDGRGVVEGSKWCVWV